MQRSAIPYLSILVINYSPLLLPPRDCVTMNLFNLGWDFLSRWQQCQLKKSLVFSFLYSAVSENRYESDWRIDLNEELKINISLAYSSRELRKLSRSIHGHKSSWSSTIQRVDRRQEWVTVNKCHLNHCKQCCHQIFPSVLFSSSALEAGH